MPLRIIALVCIVFGSIPIILVKPHIGILVWSWLSYMNPHRLTWGWTYRYSFAEIIAIVTIIAWLISREPKRIPLTPITGLMLAFTLWMCVTTVFALVPSDARKEWEWVMKVLFITYLTLPLMHTRQRIQALVWVIVISIGFYGIKGGIFVLLTGGKYMVYGPPGTFVGANNAIGFALVMVLPLMRYLQLCATVPWVRLAWFGPIALSVLAIFSTYSRGAFLAFLAMAVFLWLKSPHRLLIGAVGAAVLVTSIGFMPEAWVQRIETIQDYEEDTSVLGRFVAWRFGFNVAMERPLVGGGFAVFPQDQLYEQYGIRICDPGEVAPDCAWESRSSHSNYFQVLGEHGFVGLALYLALGLATFFTGGRIIRQARTRPDLTWARNLAAMLQVGLVGYATGGLFLNKAYFDLYYHLIAIMVLTGAVVKEALRTEREPESGMAPVPAGQRALAVRSAAP